MTTFDFFRKHQKLILYTAGIFALVSFSITGALLGFFGSLFGPGYKGPTMTLADGRQIRVTLEDRAVAQQMANRLGLPVLLPRLAEGVEGQGERVEVLAALRRLAITYGIDASDAEVNAAITRLAGELPVPEGGGAIDLQTLARGTGNSVDQYELLLREAMRIATFVRLGALGVDLSDAELVGKLAKETKKLTLRVATLDKTAIEDQLKETPVTDEELLAWIGGLEEMERGPYQSTNRVALRIAALKLGDFDPAAHADVLGGREFDDQAIIDRYNLDREILYRRPAKPADGTPGNDGEDKDKDKETEGSGKEDGGRGGPRLQGEAGGEAQDPPPATSQEQGTQDQGTGEAGAGEQGEAGDRKPVQDPYVPLDEVKDQIRKRLQAEVVLADLLAKLRVRMGAHLQAAVDARTEANAELARAREAHTDAKTKLEADPENADLQAAEAAAKTALDAAEAAYTAAKEAVDAARKAFDFRAELTQLSSAPFVWVDVAPPADADGLRELPELGTWSESWAATSIELVGDLSAKVHNTAAAAFVFQVTDLVKSPLKPIDEIRTLATENYYKKKADELAKEKREAFEAALKRLAKEAKKTEIDELEAEYQTKAEEAFTSWKSESETELADARQKVAELEQQGRGDSVIGKRWARKVAEVEAALADQEAKRKALGKELRSEYDTKIDELIAKAKPSALDAAAAEAGWTVETVGPYRKSIDQDPRFRDDEPKRVQFLFANQTVKDLDEGEATDVLEDFTNRALHLAVMEKIEDGTVADISRRRLVRERRSFESDRLAKAVAQSFTIEALRKRYGYLRAEGEPDEARAASASSDNPKSQDD